MIILKLFKISLVAHIDKSTDKINSNTLFWKIKNQLTKNVVIYNEIIKAGNLAILISLINHQNKMFFLFPSPSARLALAIIIKVPP